MPVSGRTPTPRSRPEALAAASRTSKAPDAGLPLVQNDPYPSDSTRSANAPATSAETVASIPNPRVIPIDTNPNQNLDDHRWYVAVSRDSLEMSQLLDDLCAKLLYRIEIVECILLKHEAAYPGFNALSDLVENLIGGAYEEASLGPLACV